MGDILEWFSFSDGVVVASAAFGYHRGAKNEAAAMLVAHVAARNMGRFTGDRPLLHAVTTFVPGTVGAAACFSMRRTLELDNEWRFTLKNCMLYGAGYILLNQMQAFGVNMLCDFVVQCTTEERIEHMIDAVRSGIDNQERKMREHVRDYRVAEFDRVHPAYCASLPRPETAPAPLSMDCSVCLDPIDPNQMHRILPRCKHAFHQGCIDTWIVHRRVCPFCNTPMYDSPDDDPFAVMEDEERDVGQELA